MLGSSCSPCCGTWYCCNPLSCPDFNDLFDVSVVLEIAQNYTHVGTRLNVPCNNLAQTSYNSERCVIVPGTWYAGTKSLATQFSGSNEFRYTFSGLTCGGGALSVSVSKNILTGVSTFGSVTLQHSVLGWQRNTTSAVTGTEKTLAQMQCGTTALPPTGGCPSYAGQATDVEAYFREDQNFTYFGTQIVFDSCDPGQSKTSTATTNLVWPAPYQNYQKVLDRGSLAATLTLSVSMK